MFESECVSERDGLCLFASEFVCVFVCVCVIEIQR